MGALVLAYSLAILLSDTWDSGAYRIVHKSSEYPVRLFVGRIACWLYTSKHSSLVREFGTVFAGRSNSRTSHLVAMGMTVIQGHDAMSRNAHVLPTDEQVAGYDTQVGGGTGFIAWTPEQYAQFTNPLHIDQDPNLNEYPAEEFIFDYIDVEAGGITLQEIPGLIQSARKGFANGTRPGQRWPGVYCSANTVDSVVSTLKSAALVNVPFIVADYNISAATAIARIQTATGPYPARGYQINASAFGGLADTDYWDETWLTTVSGTTPPPPPIMKDQKMVVLKVKDASGNEVTYVWNGGTVLTHITSVADNDAFTIALPTVNVSMDQFLEISGGKQPV